MKKLLFGLLFAISLVGCESEEVKPTNTFEVIIPKGTRIGDIVYRDENGKQVSFYNYSNTHSGYYQKIETQEDSCFIFLVVSDGGGWQPTDERVSIFIKKNGNQIYSHKFSECCNQEKVVIAKYFK